jgi:dipeptidyl aminopeptidase/acylaminoacyl peptidase
MQHDLNAALIEGQDGRSIRVTPRADLYLMPARGGYPRRLTTWGDVSSAAIWSPDSSRLAVEHDGRLKIVSASGACARVAYTGRLYHPPVASGDAQYGAPRWSPDGSSLLIVTSDGGKLALRIVSASGDWQRTLFESECSIMSWDWSPDGRDIAIVTRDEDAWSGAIELIRAKTGELREICREGNYEYQKPVAVWSPHGRALIIRSNRSGWSKLWMVDTNTGETRPLTTGDWDDYAFRISPDGQRIVYASRADQSGSGDDLWLMSLAEGAPSRLTRQPGVNTPLAWARGGAIAYWHESPTEPGDVWRVSAAASAPQRVTWSAPLDLERKLRAPEEVCIGGSDGTRIPALVYLPAFYREGERYPAIVWIRGGPTSVCRYDFAPTYNWLANQGFVVITPNYRGSIGYGVAHMEAVSGDGLGKHDLADIVATARFARALPQVDTHRGIGVGGRSWGGYLTLMAVTQAPDTFSCAVAGAAISDWRVQQSRTEVRYYDHWLVGGWVYEQEERVRERSPITFADRITTPLLVYHGEEDRDVPFEQIGPFVERARAAGAPITFVSYPAEGHGNQLPEHQGDVLTRTAEFFRRYLQPWNVRDNPSGRQTQY